MRAQLFGLIKDTARATLGAYASVVFARGALPGAVLLAGTFLEPKRAVSGLLAVLVATALAVWAGYSRELRIAGYYGYNALLIGLSLSHGEGPSAAVLSTVVLAAGFSVVLSASLGEALARLGLPLLALPFVIISSLLGQMTLLRTSVPPWLSTTTDLPAISAYSQALLNGVGAVIFAPSTLGGAAVIVAAALYSRINALSILAGAGVGLLGLKILGDVDPTLLVPASYNAGLTFAALASVFCVASRASLWVALFGALCASWVSVALLLPFAPVSLPVLAWPFVGITLLVLRALGLRAPGHPPVRQLLPQASPEANLAYVSTYAKRLCLPGPPRFCLPVTAAFRITQGVNGAITHRGAWSHALDFELFDEQGFPFRDHGSFLQDYYCYAQPVVSPGAGTVVAVHDGNPDQIPGQQDLSRPYGNAIVIEHGVGLYSVLAHLKPGSARVRVGEWVFPGQPLAEIGSSGRSPRPHLHFQVQRAPELGAVTIDFLISHYVVENAGRQRFERLGVPCEGETVQPLPVAPLPSVFPACDLELSQAGRGLVLLRHQVSLHGEHSLLDVTSKARLYFVQHQLGTVFTAFEGRPDSVLGALFRCLPVLPAFAGPALEFTESLPAASLLPLALRIPYELLRVLGDPVSVRVTVRCLRVGEQIVADSESAIEAFGFRILLRRGRVQIDSKGLSSLELFDANSRPLLQATRLPTGSLQPSFAFSEGGESSCAIPRSI